jgi:hypothetical protein
VNSMHEALWVITGILLWWSVANLVLAAVAVLGVP